MRTPICEDSTAQHTQHSIAQSTAQHSTCIAMHSSRRVDLVTTFMSTNTSLARPSMLPAPALCTLHRFTRYHR
jgi:hypothetical protein